LTEGNFNKFIFIYHSKTQFPSFEQLISGVYILLYPPPQGGGNERVLGPKKKYKEEIQRVKKKGKEI
jgi:hypothetical protein